MCETERRRRKGNGVAEQTGVNYVIDFLPHLAAASHPGHLGICSRRLKTPFALPPLFPTANPSYINTTPDHSADLAALQGLAHPVKVSRLRVPCQSDIQLSSFGGELPCGLRLFNRSSVIITSHPIPALRCSWARRRSMCRQLCRQRREQCCSKWQLANTSNTG